MSRDEGNRPASSTLDDEMKENADWSLVGKKIINLPFFDRELAREASGLWNGGKNTLNRVSSA